MGRSRRRHSREFKLEAVKLVVEQGRSVTQVANGLGVHPSLLQRWKTQLESVGALAFPGNGKSAGVDEEVRQLRRELATTQQERDILKNHLGRSSRLQGKNSGGVLCR